MNNTYSRNKELLNSLSDLLVQYTVQSFHPNLFEIRNLYEVIYCFLNNLQQLHCFLQSPIWIKVNHLFPFHLSCKLQFL